MIIVTSEPIRDVDWTKVYAVHLLKEIDQSIPWYVLQFGMNRLPVPSFVPSTEGIYGIPLSERGHSVRVAMNGQRWMEDISDELMDLWAIHPLNEISTVGDDCPPPDELYRFISMI